ncbi:SpoIIE family protein phosphatase [Streptomyces sp. 8N706]|uniref:SpoIIE family protein phosphatase n=1 Tax=Streptomyces sp. 8N706 TaxID=3457416 RepID=UPI003FD4F765
MRDLSFQGDSSRFPEPGDEAGVVLDSRGVVVGWGVGASRLLGYPAREVLGHPVAELMDGRTDIEALLRRDASNPTIRLGTMVLRHRNGQPVVAEVWVCSLTTPSGERQWLLQAAGTDVVAAQQFGHALLKGLFTDSPFLIDVFDRQLRFLAQNRRQGVVARSRRAGHTMREVYPAGLLDFDALEARQQHVLESGKALIGTEVVGHVVPGSPPGEYGREYVWSESILPLTDRSGKVIALAHAVSDVTAQAHARERLTLVNDASTRIGSTLDLWQTVRELTDVAVPHFADVAYVDLLDSVFEGREPRSLQEPEAVVLRRAAQRSVLEDGSGDGLTAEAVGDIDALATVAGSPSPEALMHGEPVLLNGEELRARLAAAGPDRAGPGHDTAVHSWLLVPMIARGAALGTAVFARFRNPRRFEADDVLLAQEFVARAAVCVDNASRYGRERTTALTLQRSLLPQRLPSTTAVEAVSRYLPASGHAGLGGDWFDMIPLSGARVALVVGDVVGHDLQSAVSMGRFRIAVRTLADLDMAPDALLTHLDDQVNRFVDEQGDDEALRVSEAMTATCLYAIYDPVSRHCVMARAGHPPPAVLSADGSVGFVDLPVGPPLGLGGVVFESGEIKLADGDTLVLYTDGLVESREQSLGAGLDQLRETLSRMPPTAGPEKVCDTLISELLPAQPQDDMALLVARLHGLPTECCVTWDIERVAEAVGHARKLAIRQMEHWGLGEEADITQLIVSELVTNAIRYGEEPITLRLIRSHNLICEVCDGSSTSPHARHARDNDEGGRGLYLVTQMAHSWGTRYGARGKTIWAEQVLTR